MASNTVYITPRMPPVLVGSQHSVLYRRIKMQLRWMCLQGGDARERLITSESLHLPKRFKNNAATALTLLKYGRMAVMVSTACIYVLIACIHLFN